MRKTLSELINGGKQFFLEQRLKSKNSAITLGRIAGLRNDKRVKGIIIPLPNYVGTEIKVALKLNEQMGYKDVNKLLESHQIPVYDSVWSSPTTLQYFLGTLNPSISLYVEPVTGREAK